MKKMSLRLGVGALCVALATLTTVGATSGPANADPATDADNAAGQLAAYLGAHGDHFTFDGTEFADYGLTLDGVLALDAAGVGATQSAASLQYVGNHLADYIGDGTEKYAGATAKALLTSEANTGSGELGGVDLVDRLTGLEKPTGRFSDVSSFGDFSNTVGQSLALIALTRAGETLSPESKKFLRAQQCPNGGFRITMNKVACTDSTKADADATAFAIQGLLTLPDNATRTGLLDKAASYLRSVQRANGGVAAGAPVGKPNSNTTGLAAASMNAIGKQGFADRAVGYLTALRFDCTFPASIVGLVAYDPANLQAVRAKGDTATPTGTELRATTQAVLGLSGAAYATVTSAGATADAPVQNCAP